jgi:hypothetical protein
MESTDGLALFVQDLVVRTHDIRLVVVGGRFHAVKIDLGTLPVGEIDWRPTTFKHNHQAISVPEDVANKCRKYLDGFSLGSGHFDFAVRSDGEWVFLECNPNGQWFWLEAMAGTKISASVAETLMANNARIGGHN